MGGVKIGNRPILENPITVLWSGNHTSFNTTITLNDNMNNYTWLEAIINYNDGTEYGIAYIDRDFFVNYCTSDDKVWDIAFNDAGNQINRYCNIRYSAQNKIYIKSMGYASLVQIRGIK